MKFLIFSFSILILISSCNNTKTLITKKDNITIKENTSQYYYWIHKAELAIVNLKFEKAIEYYHLGIEIK